MNQIIEELKHRNKWLEDAAKRVASGEWNPGVIAHTLGRMLRNRPTSAVTYSDLDVVYDIDVNGCGYKTIYKGERQAENREWAKYRANIAALEAAIVKRREADKVRPILEAINSLKSEQDWQSLLIRNIDNKLTEQQEQHEQERKKAMRGRPRGCYDFEKCLISTDKAYNNIVIGILDNLARGAKGKEFAIIIQAAMSLDLISKPTYRQCRDFFGYIGAESGYNAFMAKDLKELEPEKFKKARNGLTIL